MIATAHWTEAEISLSVQDRSSESKCGYGILFALLAFSICAFAGAKPEYQPGKLVDMRREGT
jgi:hypothetical protein